MTEQRPIDDQFGETLMRQIIELWAEPELKRRQEAGQWPEGTGIHAIQVIMRVDKEPEVRLNEEIRAQAQARAAEDIKAGQEVTADQISGIEDVVLTADDDPNAAHITAIALPSGWTIAFDLRYNARIVAEHLDAADEFIAAATDELENGRLRVFCEVAYGATELLVRAELLTLPDETLLKSKKHSFFSSQYNKLGSADPRFRDLLKRLEKLRKPARYLESELNFEVEEAREILDVLGEMREHVGARSPQWPRPKIEGA